MAKRSFSTAGNAWAAIADTAALTANQYMGLAGGSATQMGWVSEIYLGGHAAASTIANALFARSSTLGTGAKNALATPFTDGGLNNSISALSTPFATFSSYATTQSQRAATTTDARLNLSLNAFGGIVRWVAYPGEEWWIVGNAVDQETTLSLTTADSGATANLGAHIIYEAF